MNRVLLTTISILCISGSACIAEGCKSKNQEGGAKSCCQKMLPKENDKGLATECNKESKNSLENILKKLNEKTKKLSTYQAGIKYIFIQEPELIDSRTVRKGKLYYKKDDKQSKIRVTFETLKQDEADQEKYVEDYLFDGVWLTKIDYQLEKVDFYQQAPEDKPIDVFTHISRSFPLIGFSEADVMDKQFDIVLVSEGGTSDPNKAIHLRLHVRKDSTYKDEYKVIDFWIDKSGFLPLRVAAESPEGDIYDIVFLDSIINKKLADTVFKVETPQHFDKNRHPLKQEQKAKDIRKRL